jgi:hypothetical protein
MTVSQMFTTFGGWLLYGGLIALVGAIFVTLLYAILGSVRWLWEHRPAR